MGEGSRVREGEDVVKNCQVRVPVCVGEERQDGRAEAATRLGGRTVVDTGAMYENGRVGSSVLG